MSRYSFALASPEDDAGLRRRMAEDWMRGHLSVSFRREPSYFAGCEVQGERVEVVKCVDHTTGEIVGMGSRAIRTAFVNGVPQCVGYLADLRSHPSVRNSTLLARGYRFLRTLHEASPVPLYYTVILDGNQAAVESLTTSRAGLPQYRPLGRILTPAIHLDLPKPPIQSRGVQYERGREDTLPLIFEFIRRAHSRKQFAPLVRACPRSLSAEDFSVAIRDGLIVATAAAWDQRDFRQTHVEQYSRSLALLRPFYNLLAAMSPLKPLPAPGSAVPYFYLSWIAVEDNDPSLLRGLLRHIYRDRRNGPWHYCIAGLHESDPLAAALDDYRSIPAAGRLYVVHYEDGAAAFRSLDGRVPYVEMATV
ncbi:MAG: hypothetical protein ACREMQ_05625 [Longimicrobiales bacterium]